MKNTVAFRVFYPSLKNNGHTVVEAKEFANFVNVSELKYFTLEELCEDIFAGMNGGSGQEFPWWVESRSRSMSVGDVVFFPEDNKYFLCESCGWKELNQNEFDSWMNFPRKYGCGIELPEWKQMNEEGIVK